MYLFMNFYFVCFVTYSCLIKRPLALSNDGACLKSNHDAC